MKRRIPILLAAAFALSLSGCADVEVLNKGGETPCNEYIAQDQKEQRTTVEKWLKETQQEDQVNEQNLDSSVAAVDVLCRIQRNAETPIKNADLSGIFVQKPSE